jgi:hypothetical protein
MGVSGLFWYQLSLRGDQYRIKIGLQRYRVDFVCDRAVVDVDGNCMSDCRLNGVTWGGKYFFRLDIHHFYLLSCINPKKMFLFPVPIAASWPSSKCKKAKF